MSAAWESLREQIEDLYAQYAACLDENRFEEWPGFFTDNCLYQIIPRENFGAGLPLATIRCESRAMLLDRVHAIRNTAVYSPRAIRHLISTIRVENQAAGSLRVRANYAVFESRTGEQSQILSVGRYIDQLVREGDFWRFSEKLCVFDGDLVPSSLVYPL